MQVISVIGHVTEKLKEASRPLPRMTSFGEEELTRAIMEGDMRDAALRQLAAGRLKCRGINDAIDEDDISMILQSHGIGLESEAAEVTTDAGQPQVHEEDEEQCTGPADGIVEEAAPETILPMDDEYES